MKLLPLTLRQTRITKTLTALLWLGLALAITTTRMGNKQGIAEQRATRLGVAESRSVEWEPISMRKQTKVTAKLGGIVGGVPGGVENRNPGGAGGGGGHGRIAPTIIVAPEAKQQEREIERTAALSIVSSNPVESVQRAEGLAQSLGGFVVSSTVSGSDALEQSALIELRVPEPKLDEARRQLRMLGLHVQQESTAARDVTRDYVDQQSELRNLRAEEQQFLAILKRATKVSDITDVSERLSDVRGQIDKLESEARALAEQVQMAEVKLQILPEVKATAGLDWRPLQEARRSVRSALDGLADYFDGVVSILLHVPVVLLWAVTLAALGKAAWVVLRKLSRAFFPRQEALPKPEPAGA